jgi:hypothetical protein
MPTVWEHIPEHFAHADYFQTHRESREARRVIQSLRAATDPRTAN